jgi:hypothetical protein
MIRRLVLRWLGACPMCSVERERALALVAQAESEVGFLRGRVVDLERRLCEIAEPGVNARLAPKPAPLERPGQVITQTRHGYELPPL